MGGFVSISVYEETRDRFRKFMIDDESYDAALNRLLNFEKNKNSPVPSTKNETGNAHEGEQYLTEGKL